MTDRPTTEPRPSAAERMANAAEMLLDWTSHPDDPAYRHWLTASRADLQRELDAYRAEAAQGAAPLAETMTRLADGPRSKWHDEVLPNGAGESWACVPIGDVLNALPPAQAAPRAEGLDVETIIRVMDLSMEAAGDDQHEAAEWILARLSRPSDQRVPESEEPR